MEWISVNERLPEYGQRVVAIVSGVSPSGMGYEESYEIATYYDDAWDIDYAEEWEDPHVSYWFALEPPENNT